MQALNVIKQLINEEDNSFLMSTPTIEEVKDNVFSIDLDSAPSPDGLSGIFFQTAWLVISGDIYRAVVSFFHRAFLQKFFIHTCLIMLPKVDSPQDF